MNYSQAIFGNDLNSITYANIEDYFTVNRDETLNLEFKSYPTTGSHADKEKSIIKAICGLLNSEGGIVIWGAPIETTDPQGNTSAVGALTPFSTTLDRDRLINKISSLITPLPVGIKVQKLDNGGESIFVIEVPKSSQKPHQYRNHYYIRLDGQTKIAPHYLIESMMKSVNYPVIRGHIRLKRIELQEGNTVLRFRHILYNTSQMINDIEVHYKFVAGPGTLLINGQGYVGFYENDTPILSYGRPISDDFSLVISRADLARSNNEVTIAFNFVGQKSPSKTSVYTYSLENRTLGPVTDESRYLIRKDENQRPTDVSTDSDDDKIESILSYQ